MIRRIFIGFILAVLLLPSVAFAQDTVEECRQEYSDARSGYSLGRCIGEIAVKEENPDLCEEESGGSRYECVSFVAVELERTDLCMTLNQGQSEEICVGKIAAKQNNSKLCDLFENDLEKYRCFDWVAWSLNDYKICEFIISKKEASREVIDKGLTKEKCIIDLRIEFFDMKVLGVIGLFIFLVIVSIYLFVLSLRRRALAVYLLGGQPIVLLIVLFILRNVSFSPLVVFLNASLISLLFLYVYSWSAYLIIQMIGTRGVAQDLLIKKVISIGLIIMPAIVIIIPLILNRQPLLSDIAHGLILSGGVAGDVTNIIIVLGSFVVPTLIMIIYWAILKKRGMDKATLRTARNIALLLIGSTIFYLYILYRIILWGMAMVAV